ncbi:MAG: TPM domain-containing protein [Bacteroidales bacterium]|nr:TPM domain-containing protein [Bacteroidales bacterium]
MAKQAQSFFTKTEEIMILEAIREAETNTSGEIRIHVENRCKGDVLNRASVVFDLLKMQKTKLRNGVLFYLAIQDKKFAILGDSGINAKVADDFWDDIKILLLDRFKKGDFALGISQGILKAGEQLREHFEYMEDDINELPDDISFGK